MNKTLSSEEKAKLQEQEKAMLEDIESGITTFKKDRSSLIPALQMIQQRYSYLAPASMKIVGDHLDIPTSEVYGVATFYNQFKFNPPGKHPIKVCLGTACHVSGGDIILENFERKLGIRDGETTEDREFSLERVACVGCCALAPVAVIGETVQGHMAPSKVEGLLLGFEIEKEKQDRERRKSESGE